MKIRVIVDSSADISPADANRLDVSVIRFPITIKDQEFIEGVSLDQALFESVFENREKIITSQAPLGQVLDFWEELLNEYDHLIYLPISEGISGAYQTAVAAAQDFEGKITVVNTKAVAYPQQLLVKQVKDMIELGYQPEQIKSLLEESEPMFALLIPNNLDYLKLGGRISPQAAALGNLLKITPILKVEDGKIDYFDKVRTYNKAIKKSLDYLLALDLNPDEYYFYIVHHGCEEKAAYCKDYLEDKLAVEVDLAPLRAIILSHTGPQTIGLGVMKKINF